MKDNRLKWRTQVFDAPTEAHDAIFLEQMDRLVVLVNNDQVPVLFAEDGHPETALPALEGNPSALANLRDGRHFLIGDTRSYIRRVDGQSMQVVAELPIGTEANPRKAGKPIRSISVSNDGKWATVIARSDVVYLVDLINWTVADSVDWLVQPRISCFMDSKANSATKGTHRLWLITRPGLINLASALVDLLDRPTPKKSCLLLNMLVECVG